MTPSKFTEVARSHGLLVKQCGFAAIQTLKLIAEMPVEPRKITMANRYESSSPVPHIGVLILNGFARLEDGAYRATPHGREWLGKVLTMISNYQQTHQ